MDDCKTSRLFGVFFEENNRGIGAIRGEFGDFSQGVLVSISMGGTGNVDSIWEEGAEKIGFGVKGRVYGGCKQNLWDWWRGVGEERGEFESE